MKQRQLDKLNWIKNQFLTSGKNPRHFGAFLTLALSIALLGCDTAEQEQEIHHALYRGAQMIENDNPKAIFQLTTRDFIAHPGKLNRSNAFRQLYLLLKSASAATVLFPTPDIEFDTAAETALVTVPFAIVPLSTQFSNLDQYRDDPEAWTEHLQGRGAEVQRAELSFVKQGEQWLVQTLRIH